MNKSLILAIFIQFYDYGILEINTMRHKYDYWIYYNVDIFFEESFDKVGGVIPGLWGQRQACEFETNLGSICRPCF